MRRRNTTILIILFVIMALAIASLAVNPVFGRDGMRLGLDLKGGVYLEYQVVYPEGTSSAQQSDLLDRAIAVIRTRIDRFGVTEPVVQSVGSNRIAIQLPGFSDIDQAKSLVEQTGFLEFREIELDENGSPVTLGDYLDETELSFINKSETGSRYFAEVQEPVVAVLEQNAEGNLVFVDINGNPISTETLQDSTNLYSWVAARGTNGTQLTGAFLTSATPEVQTTTTGTRPVVRIEWDSEGSTIFDQIAARLFVRPDNSPQRDLGIFLDKTLISAPEINSQSYSGTAIIEGSFTTSEATNLANLLSSGSLPMPLEKPPIYQDTISASLGANFTKMSIIAGIIAFLLIIIFMSVYYRIPGAMASVALIFYAAIVLAIFKLWPITLSLAGIGGFVLSLGIAVDANVIIFERLKEEVRGGRTLGAAIEAGFNRAWLAIRDSNITTIVACIILIWIGGLVPSGQPVRGFGITLFIGVVMSMFTSLIVTRALLRSFVGTGIGRKTSLFSVFTGRK